MEKYSSKFRNLITILNLHALLAYMSGIGINFISKKQKYVQNQWLI